MEWISLDDSKKPEPNQKVRFKRILELDVVYKKDDDLPPTWIADRDSEIEMKEYWMPLP